MDIAHAIPIVLTFIILALTILNYINQRHLRALKLQIKNLHKIKCHLDNRSESSESHEALAKLYTCTCTNGEYIIHVMKRPCKFKAEILEFRNLKDQLRTNFSKPV